MEDTRVRGARNWVSLIAFESAAIVGLHWAGGVDRLSIDWANFSHFLETSTTTDATVALLRLVGLVLAYWLLGSTLLYSLATVTRIPAAVRAVEWTTIPAVRRIVDSTVAVSITLSSFSAAGAAVAQVPMPPPPVVQDVGEVGPYIPTPAGPDQDQGSPDSGPADDSSSESSGSGEPTTPTGTEDELVPPQYVPTPAGLGDEDETPSASVVSSARSASEAYEVIVVHGDHLWALSEEHLAIVMGVAEDDLGVRDLDRYWRHLVSLNMDTSFRSQFGLVPLRSGDPDLIYPGEGVVCPKVIDVLPDAGAGQ